ncbi:hypothetical protein Tco_0785777, partial [Tanacetum coccineum]
MPRVPLSYQASACSLITLHFLKFSENSFEVLKLLENNVEVLKILENKLESLKLQENQPVDGLVLGGSIWRDVGSFWREYRATGGIDLNFGSRSRVGVGSFLFFDKIKPERYEIVENHREEEDQEGNNSPEIETLTYHDVTTKFNRPDCNLDCPPLTCQFQVFKSLCKSIGLRSVIRIDHQELKKVIWYVLHNSLEIDTYRAKFK